MSILPDTIRGLVKKLPEPVSTYGLGGALLEVYRVRNLLKDIWPDAVLKKLLLAARSSYDRYGKRPLLDKYDLKSAIYVARVIYYHDKQPEIKIEEWLSVRFTPGNGKPLGNGELEIYSFSGRSIAEYLRGRLGLTQAEFMKSVLSSSRMCGIHPYISDDQVKVDVDISSKHQYTPICFALIQDQFYRDYGYPYRYITEIIRSDFAEKGLVILQKGKSFKPASTPAEETMGFNKGDIKLDMGVYAYAFPLYWLNIGDLLHLLEELVLSGDITGETLQYYLGVQKLDNIEGRALLRLKNILGARDRLLHSKITGSDLRNLVQARVGYVPELKINDPMVWRKSILEMIEAAEVKLV